jgi:hypothetical protein
MRDPAGTVGDLRHPRSRHVRPVPGARPRKSDLSGPDRHCPRACTCASRALPHPIEPADAGSEPNGVACRLRAHVGGRPTRRPARPYQRRTSRQVPPIHRHHPDAGHRPHRIAATTDVGPRSRSRRFTPGAAARPGHPSKGRWRSSTGRAPHIRSVVVRPATRGPHPTLASPAERPRRTAQSLGNELTANRAHVPADPLLATAAAAAADRRPGVVERRPRLCRDLRSRLPRHPLHRLHRYLMGGASFALASRGGR